MEAIKLIEANEKMHERYTYLYDLGNAMFAYHDSIYNLTSEQIELIANSLDADKVYGMYLAACYRQKIRYSYSTFSKNTDAIRAAKRIKRSK